MLLQQRSEASLSSEEVLQRSLGPIDRALRVFDVNNPVAAAALAASSSSSRAYPALSSPTEGEGTGNASDARGDLALVMAASAVERRRVAELSRTDVIVTKQKQAEIKEASKRKYHATLIKITFSDKVTVRQQAVMQGSGRYGGNSDNPARLPGGGYKLSGIKAKYGVPNASPQQQPQQLPSSTAPMELEEYEEEEKKSSGAPLPIAVPVNPAAASSSVSPSAASASAASAATPPPSSSSCSSTSASTASSLSPLPASVAAAAPAPVAEEVLLTAYFRPWETLGDVFVWLQRDILVHGNQTDPFYLHLPPATKLQCGGPDPQGKHKELVVKSLNSLGMVPAASLIFHFTATGAANSAADVAGAGGALAAVKSDVLACKERFDGALLASLMPQAENKAELEAAKAKLMAEAKQALKAADPFSTGGVAPSSSLSLAAEAADEDGDIEAFMRRKKAAAAAKAAAASKQSGSSGGGGAAARLSGSGSSSSAAGSGAAGGAGGAAAKRNIPGLFKPR
jgi:hypothetical protein